MSKFKANLVFFNWSISVYISLKDIWTEAKRRVKALEIAGIGVEAKVPQYLITVLATSLYLLASKKLQQKL